jgi:hypothetical protein
MIGALLNEAGGGASDMLPTGPGGTGIPKNRMQLENRQAMDEDRARRAAARQHSQNCDPTLGGGTSAHGVAPRRCSFPWRPQEDASWP